MRAAESSVGMLRVRALPDTNPFCKGDAHFAIDFFILELVTPAIALLAQFLRLRGRVSAGDLQAPVVSSSAVVFFAGKTTNDELKSLGMEGVVVSSEATRVRV